MLQAVLSFLAPTLFLTIGVLVSLALGLTVFWIVRRPGLEAVLKWTKRARQRLWKWVTDRENRVSRYIAGIAVVLVLVLMGLETLGREGKWGSLAPMFVSTAVVIAVLDRLFNYRAEQREKRRVISHMGATDSNDVALAALAVARAEGWLKDGTLKGVHLENANLQGGHLEAAHLEGANLGGANLQGANFRGANLQRARLMGANLKGADLLGANLRSARLMGANLQGVYLMKADLQSANLLMADLQGAYLVFAKMQNTGLGYANLQGAHLEEANLQGADLTGVNLQGADLKNANLQDAKYSMYSETGGAHGPKLCVKETIWPEGFNPSEAGCILVDGFGDLVDG